MAMRTPGTSSRLDSRREVERVVDAEAGGRHAPSSLTELLDRLDAACRQRPRMNLAQILEALGTRSFGPILLVAGLLTVLPIAGVPGFPTLVGALVVVIAVQLLIGRPYFWLPQWLMRRRLSSDKLERSLRWMRRPARWVDSVTRARLVVLTQGASLHVIAALCILVAAMMPPLELVPFSAALGGGALMAFGLALIARDGVLALAALALIAAGLAIVLFGLL